MKPHGFSITEFMLVFSLVAASTATLIPPLMRVIDQQHEKAQINNAINEIYEGMTLALTTHWARTQCRGAPALTLTNLINNYSVPPDVTARYNPQVKFLSASSAPFNATALAITFIAKPENVYQLANVVNKKGRWLTINANNITLTQPVTVIDSMAQRNNYNPINGCL
ncbi:pilus assembly FimT family protein [Moritella viscosa]|uniref:Hypothetical polyprotein n=1 Tax=Moritella viscosa TaxID=80854 RepID=A0ABY1HKL7_9GAMM|nr:hypothetical protein [Moritella viscosa]SGZ04450.1 Hypothetical polyprotein [Moritella viscosa]